MYTDNPERDAEVWNDEQEAKHHKFEQACYNLSFTDEYKYTTYESLCDALSCMSLRDIENLESHLRIAEDGAGMEFEALGRYILETSRLHQMDRIEEAVSSEYPGVNYE